MRLNALVLSSIVFAAPVANAARHVPYDVQALQVLSSIAAASEFVNNDPNATGYEADARFLKNQFDLLLSGALGGDIGGWGTIRVKYVGCQKTSAGKMCSATLEYNAMGKQANTYTFESPAASGQAQKVTVLISPQKIADPRSTQRGPGANSEEPVSASPAI